MIIDTVYFTHSHHSRFLQLTDLIIFMAGRYERLGEVSQKWHEREMLAIWTELKQQSDLTIKNWP
jgi:ABC-type molybdate transport system ATPase subunit